jgi:hypothetical protein
MSLQLKQLLQGVFKQENWKLQLLANWDTIVGNLADKMRVDKIEGNTLYIGVYQSSWMHELFLLSAVLKKTINNCLDKPRIKHIRLKYASKKETTKKKKIVISKQIIFEPISLSSKEEHALVNIKDDELKEALHSFLSRCHYQKIS